MTDNNMDVVKSCLKSIKTSVELCKSILTTYREIIALAGKSSYSWSPESIVEMLNAAAEVYKSRFNSSIQIKIIMPERIEGYPNSYIVGLLSPILENAIEASTDSGNVSIIGHQLNDIYSIEVRNCTNNPPQSNKIYEDGFSTKKNHEGTGLTIVHRLLSAYHGSSISHIVDGNIVIFTLNIPVRLQYGS
jgi:signal transduction histidine kinase